MAVAQLWIRPHHVARCRAQLSGLAELEHQVPAEAAGDRIGPFRVQQLDRVVATQIEAAAGEATLHQLEPAQLRRRGGRVLINGRHVLVHREEARGIALDDDHRDAAREQGEREDERCFVRHLEGEPVRTRSPPLRHFADSAEVGHGRHGHRLGRNGGSHRPEADLHAFHEQCSPGGSIRVDAEQDVDHAFRVGTNCGECTESELAQRLACRGGIASDRKPTGKRQDRREVR